MVSAEMVKDIDLLRPNEQILVFSMIKSFLNQRDHVTPAQEQFARERKKYEGRDMSMEEIDAIIHERM